jgi:hypothetical protein
VRTVIHEAIADLDEATGKIVIVIHWVGGAHTEHQLQRRRRGQRNSNVRRSRRSRTHPGTYRQGRRHRRYPQP